MSGFKLAFGLGYSEFTDENTSPFAPTVGERLSQFFQVGGYAQHIATGLFVHGAYGTENNNNTLLTNGFIEPNSEQWYVKAGIRRKWLPLGATVVYGDYALYKDQLGPAALLAGITSSDLERFGGGIAQELDSASMTVYAKYQHYTADVTGVADFQDADFISLGALINF